MKYVEEFRNKELVGKLTEEIRKISRRPVSLMEVCGGHTLSIHKFGIKSLLPETITLLSGPGCPVCVTPRRYIDQAIAYSRLKDVIITTYGDLIRVPGSSSSLDREKASGGQIRIVYSSLEALEIATQNPEKKIIFLGIGFETTSPASAAALLNAQKQNLNNFFLFSSHKVMPPAMAALIDEGVKLNGYICPGHVSVITGTAIYEDIPRKYGLGCVISGFEPLDILQSVYMLVKQYETKTPGVEIAYKRVVKPEGNIKAQEMLATVFEYRDDSWRGFGILKNSGLAIRESFARFDAERNFHVKVEETLEDVGCICGIILKGLKTPRDCKLFGSVCHPGNPIGACMVSSEGACHTHYMYNR